MRDLGIQKPFLQNIDIGTPQAKNYIGFRKIFTDYLTKLNVPFIDLCCNESNIPFSQPVRYNTDTGDLERYDSDGWSEVPGGGGVQAVDQESFIGDGVITQFDIPHGLAGTPKFLVTAASQDAEGIAYCTADGTNIHVFYNLAPPDDGGSSNVLINWIANL